MHILYLSAPGGGLETNVRVLAPALIAEGHQVSLLYLHTAAEPQPRPSGANDIPTYHATIGDLHYYASRATFGKSSLARVIRSLEAARALTQVVKMIHQQHPIDLIELPEFALAFQRLPAPFIVRLHAAAWILRTVLAEGYSVADAIEKRLEGETLRRAAAISSPSRMLADLVRRECELATPIEIIPYPVDTQRFCPAPKDSARKRALFVGRVEARKGADVLLQVIPQILARHSNAEFWFAGRISDELRALVAAAPAQVKFLGIVPHAELIPLYQQAAIVVVPSLWDNSPNVIYEAMACGTPVIATCVGGIPELVEHGVTGWLVPPRDVKALGEAISQLLCDSSRLARMAEKTRAKAVNEFAVEQICSQTLALYERAIQA